MRSKVRIRGKRQAEVLASLLYHQTGLAELRAHRGDGRLIRVQARACRGERRAYLRNRMRRGAATFVDLGLKTLKGMREIVFRAETSDTPT